MNKIVDKFKVKRECCVRISDYSPFSGFAPLTEFPYLPVVQDVKTLPDLGKSISWSDVVAPVALRQFVDYSKKVRWGFSVSAICSALPVFFRKYSLSICRSFPECISWNFPLESPRYTQLSS
jgi:hypothetical protein